MGAPLPVFHQPSKEELVARGERDAKAGVSAMGMRVRVDKAAKGDLSQGGMMPVRDLSLARYFGYRLEVAADKIGQAKGFDSPEYNQYKARADEWAEWTSRTFGSELFHNIGEGLQGIHEIDPSNYTSSLHELEKVAKARGSKVTKEEKSELGKRVKRSKEAEEDTGEGMDELLNVGYDVATTEPLDQGQQQTVQSAMEKSQAEYNAVFGDLTKEFPKGASMAAKGKATKPPPLTEDQVGKLAKAGSHIMRDMSKRGNLTDDAWWDEMLKRFGGIEQHRAQIQTATKMYNDVFISNYVGGGAATQAARNRLSRKRPAPEVSKEAIKRALEVDPQGHRITPAEAFHAWNYVKQVYVDGKVIRDFTEMLFKAAKDLGTDSTRLYRALTSNRTTRRLAKEVIKRMRTEARVKSEARNWLKNQEYPGWLRFVRSVPRYFFMDKIFGHGLVPMITHAGNMMFNPYSWGTYFPAWLEMYRMTFGSGKLGLSGAEYHTLKMGELINHPNFEFWRSSKIALQCDPFRLTDDYQIYRLKKALGGLVEGRGFDALKTLRLARAEQWWDMVPDHLKTQDMAALIAEDVNHATGIVKTRFHEALNWAMFAPKLEASRWAFVFKDTIKAANYLAHWRTASPEQLWWAKRELTQKAAMVGMYYGMLAMNQGFLKLCGSDQQINFDDPTESDFMAFKVAGYKIGFVSPMIGMVRLFANMLHAGQGELRPREKMEPRQNLMDTAIGKYARGKFSPFASAAYDLATQQDFMGRPLPWSSDVLPRYKRMQGVEPYTPLEYGLNLVAPIPAEEAISTWMEMGMDATTARKLAHSLITAVSMGMTGARVVREQND